MIAFLAIFMSLIGLTGEAALTEASDKYSSAQGIQWKIQSVVFSEIFEEADTTILEYLYSPPDTFSLIGDQEKIMGIGDTLWVMSERHKQVHKKNTDGSTMPIDFILNWNDNYDLVDFTKDGSNTAFFMRGKENIKPSDLIILIDKKTRIKSISYTDTSGDLVTLSIKDEKLERPRKFNLFYLEIPNGYDFIDLTE